MRQMKDQEKNMDDFFEETIDVGESIDFMRYIRGLVKRWWLVGGLFIAGFTIGFFQVKKQKPMYEGEAWISFENIQGAIPANQIQNRIAKLRTRSFSEEATAKLGLTLQITNEPGQPGLLREDVFSYFSTNNNPASGDYQLRFIESGSCQIYYNSERIEARTVQSCIEDTISFNGISFKLNPDIVPERRKIDFKINDFQGTVRSLIARTKVRPTPDGSLMRLTLQDGNARIAAKTVNLLAELFVTKSEDLRREATRFNREFLEEQLELVKTDLDRSDAQLRSFRGSFIQGLDQETEAVVTRLSTLQTRIAGIDFHINEMTSLLSKLDPSNDGFDENIPLAFVYREIGAHQVFENDPDMKIARDGLRTLNAERDGLIGKGLPERNPDVMEISEKIFLTEENIRQMAIKKINELKATRIELNSQMDQQQNRLARLPDEELRYIRINRDRRAFESLYENLYNRLKGAEITEAIPMERVSIMDPAVPSFVPVNAKSQMLMIWTLGGLVLGIGLALILEMADKSVRSSDDVSSHLRLKILGTIPKVKFDSYELQDSEKAKSISSQIVTHDYSPTPVGEAYRALRTSLLFSKSIGSIKTLVISSAAPGEGKSFTAANLTITMAQQKSKTLLVDADLRRGVLHNTFNCQKKPGLTNYLTGVASLEDVFQETYIPNLSLISCGSMIPNPSELLGSERMQKFVAGISNRFDMVVFDTPPLLAASDAVILGTLVDGVAMVVRSGHTHRDTIKRKLELFQNVQARVLGAILNCAGVEVAHEGYSYYSY
ncbi:polysaccharide biosynthesis tyrosine autokinase [bacterium]|nr:polysaccharide biosynthesis tyrosine autokinase [bacterium]